MLSSLGFLAASYGAGQVLDPAIAAWLDPVIPIATLGGACL